MEAVRQESPDIERILEILGDNPYGHSRELIACVLRHTPDLEAAIVALLGPLHAPTWFNKDRAPPSSSNANAASTNESSVLKVSGSVSKLSPAVSSPNMCAYSGFVDDEDEDDIVSDEVFIGSHEPNASLSGQALHLAQQLFLRNPQPQAPSCNRCGMNLRGLTSDQQAQHVTRCSYVHRTFTKEDTQYEDEYESSGELLGSESTESNCSRACHKPRDSRNLGKLSSFDVDDDYRFLECAFCGERLLEVHFVPCHIGCPTQICGECYGRQMRVYLRNAVPLKPCGFCQNTPSVEEMEHFCTLENLPRVTFARYLRIAYGDELRRKGYRFCANEACQSALEIIVLEDSVVCSECYSQTCLLHDALALNETEARTGLEQSMALISMLDTKACPKCGEVFENDGRGCRHFQCSACKHEFFWCCLRAYRDKEEARLHRQLCPDVTPPPNPNSEITLL